MTNLKEEIIEILEDNGLDNDTFGREKMGILIDQILHQFQSLIEESEPEKKEEYTELTPLIRKYNKENGYPEDLQEPIWENQGYNSGIKEYKAKLLKRINI